MEKMEKQKSVFETLFAVNCNDHTEKKNGLTYLSWPFAWAEVKKRYPGAFYTIYENPDGWNYFTDGRTCWVKTGMSIEGLELIEYLPVMDHKNASIPVDKVTSFDVNKAIQRSLTKAVARHGLGLYIYAGEDLPEEEAKAEKPEPKPRKRPEPKKEPEKDGKPEKEKPVVKEGDKLWPKAVEYCLKHNLSAADLRKWYTISDKDAATLDNVLAFDRELNK